MAITKTFRGFNDLGRLVTPIFLSMDQKNLQSRSLNFLQNASLTSAYWPSSFCCAGVSNASLRVKICENDGNI